MYASCYISLFQDWIRNFPMCSFSRSVAMPRSQPRWLMRKSSSRSSPKSSVSGRRPRLEELALRFTVSRQVLPTWKAKVEINGFLISILFKSQKIKLIFVLNSISEGVWQQVNLGMVYQEFQGPIPKILH